MSNKYPSTRNIEFESSKQAYRLCQDGTLMLSDCDRFGNESWVIVPDGSPRLKAMQAMYESIATGSFQVNEEPTYRAEIAEIDRRVATMFEPRTGL